MSNLYTRPAPQAPAGDLNDIDPMDDSDSSVELLEQPGKDKNSGVKKFPINNIKLNAPRSNELQGKKLVAEVKKEVDGIVQFSQAEPRVLAKNCGLKTSDYLGLWGASLAAAAAITPNVEGNYSLPASITNGPGRVTNAIGMNEVRKTSAAARENEIKDCIRYFNLRSSIERLLVLEKGLKDKLAAQGPSAEMEKCLGLINSTHKKLLGDANKLEQSVIHAPLSKLYEAARGMNNFIRGTGVGSVSAGNAVMQSMVGGYSTQLGTKEVVANGVTKTVKSKLVGEVAGLSTAVAGLTAGISLANGISHGVTAGLEFYSAGATRAALHKDSQNDRRVCATYGVGIPELGDLARWRKDARSLKFLQEKMIQVQAGVRSLHAQSSAALAAMGIASFAGVSTATFGAAPAALAAVAGIFLMTLQIRQWLSAKEQRAWDKEVQRLAALYGGNTIPGLALSTDAPGDHRVADGLAKVLLGEPEAANRCKRALIEMGLPESVVDVTGKSAKQVAEQLRPFLLASNAHGDKEVIEKQYKDSKTAAAAVNVLAYQIAKASSAVEGQAVPENKPWHKQLARGADATDIRKSSFDKKTLHKLWDDAEFKSFVTKALSLEPAATADVAWTQLQKARKTTAADTYETDPKAHKNVTDTVMRWLVTQDEKAIQKSLLGKPEDAFAQACQNELMRHLGNPAMDWFPDKPQIEAAALKALQAQALNLETIGLFAKASQSGVASVRETVQQKAQDLIKGIQVKVHEDDRAGFDAAIGIAGGANGEVPPADLPAVLDRLEKFLFISRKLQGEKLEKVIASLHTYPTAGSGVPDQIVREAAMLEIRRRFPAPVVAQNSSLAEKAKVEEDFRHTMELVHALRGEKLHTHGWSSGDGGGVFLLGGYVLNDKGLLIKNLLERSKAGGAPQAELSGKQLKAMAEQVPGSRNALSYWAGRWIGENGVESLFQRPVPPEQTPQALAHKLDLWHKPGALEKALSSGRGPAFDEAAEVFRQKFREAGAAVLQSVAHLNSDIDSEKDSFNPAAFVQQMQTHFELEALGRKHNGLLPPGDAIAEDMKLQAGGRDVLLTPERLDFYRAALSWNNTTARAKNAKAIEKELTTMQAGESGAANRFWSAQFLDARPLERQVELNKLSQAHAWLTDSKGKMPSSYKQFVKRYEELGKMSGEQVHKALQSDPAKGLLWRQWLLTENRLDVGQAESLVSGLNAKGSSQRETMAHLAGKLKELGEQEMQAMLDRVFASLVQGRPEDVPLLSTGAESKDQRSGRGSVL